MNAGNTYGTFWGQNRHFKMQNMHYTQIFTTFSEITEKVGWDHIFFAVDFLLYILKINQGKF